MGQLALAAAQSVAAHRIAIRLPFQQHAEHLERGEMGEERGEEALLVPRCQSARVRYRQYILYIITDK